MLEKQEPSANTKMDVSTDEITERRKPRIVVKEGSIVPRKGHTQKRDVLADPLYNNKVVTKLINNIMLDGKKGVAQKIVYGAFNKVEEKTGKPAVEVFEEAMNNVMPVLEVKAKRIGGATYQVPIEVKPERRQALALRWLTMFSRKRGEKTMEDKLANEIMDVEKLGVDVGIGDIIGGRDYLTGMYGAKPVENITCSITAGVISKEYELEGENDDGNS